jgi:hypothetical protein
MLALTVMILRERTIIDILCRLYSPIICMNISLNAILLREFSCNGVQREDFNHRTYILHKRILPFE